MADLQHDAEYIGKAAIAEYGKNPKSNKKEIRIFMEIVEGPLAGRRVKWTANMKTDKSIAYSKRDMIAAGWKGKDIATFVSDVAAATAAGLKLPFTARLASNGVNEDGSPNEWWTVGSIGVGAVPLAKATADDDRDVNDWFDRAGDVAPASSRGNSCHPNAPGNGDDSDLPF
jgi:hypothetical protein